MQLGTTPTADCALFAHEPQELEARVSSLLDGHRKTLVAVSGGADSMALLHLAATVVRPDRLHVATVDHGLRPEAADEARMVASVAHDYGLAHSILTLPTRPTKAAQARIARYDTLTERALELGATAILLGHTATDQRETVVMRSLRMTADSATRGLAGIPQRATHALSPGRSVALLRPLLCTTRETLSQLARHEWRLPVADDPANVDPLHERARIRRSGALLTGTVRLAKASAACRGLQAVRVAEAIDARVTVKNGAICIADPSQLPQTLLAEVLGTLLLVAGGQANQPSRTQLHRAAALVLAGNPSSHALARCLITVRRQQTKIVREARNPPSLPVPQKLHDGRYWVEADGSLTPFIAALERFRPVTDDPIHAAVCKLLHRAD